MDCVFCRIANDANSATHVLQRGNNHAIFEPLSPHAPGHVLVVPRMHVRDAGEDVWTTGLVFRAAAAWASERHAAFNLITSAGRRATQSVFHLHVHVVPRDADDGLAAGWPWRV